MSFVQNFYTSRDNNNDPTTNVGQAGRLWYSPATNSIYVSDGVTPGGNAIDLALGANATFNSVTANSATINTNLVVTGNISPAAANKIGGIAPGPGVDISNEGILTIDTAGLPLSFGDFTANVNQLSMVNDNEDMYLVAKGTGDINLIGGVNFYKPNGFPPTADPFFQASIDGQIRILVPDTDLTTGAVEIVGSSSGQSLSTVNTGVMLHITGQNNVPSRLYNDGIDEFAAFVGRRINGNVTVPTAVQAGDEIIRISSTGYNGTEIPGGGSARIVYQAIENYTPGAQGSNLSFWTCAVGSNVLTKIATVDVANGVAATQMSSTGNVLVGNTIKYSIDTNDAGNVTQLTSKATTVTANGRSGRITMNNASLSQNTTVTFTVNNTYVTQNDVVVMSLQNPVTSNVYFAFVSRVANGAFDISIRNSSNSSLSDAIVLNFAVIKVA